MSIMPLLHEEQHVTGESFFASADSDFLAALKLPEFLGLTIRQNIVKAGKIGFGVRIGVFFGVKRILYSRIGVGEQVFDSGKVG